MPLRTLLLSTLEDSGVASLTKDEPTINTNIYGNHILNVVRSCAIAIHPLTWLIADVLKDAFPQTAEGEVLDKNFGAMENLLRKAASKASGNITVYAPNSTAIPIFTEFTTPEGAKLKTKQAAVVSQQITSFTSSVNVNGNVTFTTSTAHNIAKGSSQTFATGDVLIDGVREIIGSTDYTFSINISNTTPINVSGTASSYYAVIPAETEENGSTSNITGSFKLTGDFEAYTLFIGLSGGADSEADNEYRTRIIKTRGALEGVFTKPQIELAALSVSGNTRAWCVTPQSGVYGGTHGVAGYKPQPGEVCVYFLRDNDSPIIPDANEIAITKTAVVQKGRMPAHTLEEDIFVFAPNLVSCQIQIMNLVPNTPEMRLAIEKEIKAYFEDFVDFEQSVTNQQLTSVISSTTDSTNSRPSSFLISSNGFTPNSGDILIYGEVSWL